MTAAKDLKHFNMRTFKEIAKMNDLSSLPDICHLTFVKELIV